MKNYAIYFGIAMTLGCVSGVGYCQNNLPYNPKTSKQEKPTVYSPEDWRVETVRWVLSLGSPVNAGTVQLHRM